MSTAYVGYPGAVWGCCYAALQWLNGTLNTSNPINSTSAIQTVYATLRNGMYAVQAWQTWNAWSNELVFLQETQALNLNLSAPTQVLFNARIQALQAAIADMPHYMPTATPATATNTLAQGAPSIAYTGLIEGWMTSAYEAVPAGLTSATLVSTALAEVAAWQEVFNAVVTFQGLNGTQAQDAPNRMLAVSTYIANTLAQMQSGPFDSTQTVGASDLSTLWNQMVALPSLYTLASLLYSPPHLVINQECGAIRHTLGIMADNLAILLLTLRKASVSIISLAEVRTGDNLMDVAARNLGDYSQWSNIAALNGLSPPWTGYPTGNPAVASYGERILLPPSTGGVTAGGPVPSYTNDVLGVDIYLGPINQPMVAWQGDFQTVAGYGNLSLSLGRRLQTTIGDLIYHTEFGSRIPPEVGSIQDSYELERIAAYAESALLSDPRVDRVVSATATAPQGSNSLVQFVGVVLPKGYGVQPVTVNVTLSPGSASSSQVTVT